MKKLKVDDYMMVATLVPYTALLVTMNIVANTNSNLIPPNIDVNDFGQQEVDERIYGSKLVVVVEQMQCITIWSLKGCLIFLYYRLTVNLGPHIYVLALIGYIIATFVIMEVLYLGVWCRPFNNYWAVPTPNVQCNTATDHLITNTVFNLTSDLAMLVIGFSLFIRSKLPWGRKLILAGVFSLGIFVILAAVLNKYYSFAHPFGSEWTFWYIRESSTAMIVANLPFVWTLLRRIFKLQAFNGEPTQRTVPYHSSRSARGRHTKTDQSNSRTNPKSDVHRSSNKSKSNQDSHNSSIDMKHFTKHQQSSPNDLSFADMLGPGGMAPLPSAADAQSLPKPAKRPSFKEQGLFGREDLELMLDPWDSGAEEDKPTCPRDSMNSGTRPGTISVASNRESVISRRSTDRTPGSPTSSKRRSRIRDEEAQYNLQEDVYAGCNYYEGPPDWVSETTEMGNIDEEGRIVDASDHGDLTQPPQRPPSACSEPKTPIHGEQRLSRSGERKGSLAL
ncbi:hypothetical protein EG327_009953 [Venturia inaequalis]|uniref:Rhodopsin domain-containing protein n=2 Tax=Venturia inaequalis TaxID=5025 RepID=A0A8H3YRT2_VENIN|nr:hypothetical protein EG327_009953 [Venturia inaequalis]